MIVVQGQSGNWYYVFAPTTNTYLETATDEGDERLYLWLHTADGRAAVDAASDAYCAVLSKRSGLEVSHITWNLRMELLIAMSSAR